MEILSQWRLDIGKSVNRKGAGHTANALESIGAEVVVRERRAAPSHERKENADAQEAITERDRTEPPPRATSASLNQGARGPAYLRRARPVTWSNECYG